ncbi:uncharacterized protein LOC135373462 [Ornithodoros turicata]|uniref:uncharacterized protein LOC135373462 n=1 Tax=Ornithodoros turicata TaxID=34597 RepID=UPI00313A0A32
MAEGYFRQVQLEVNPRKAQYFGWTWSSQRDWFRYDVRPIIVCGEVAPSLDDAKIRDIKDTIDKAALKPFQRLHCYKELIVQRRLYTVANSINVLGQIQKLDAMHVKDAKKFLQVPGSFPTSHLWLPNRRGGLGMLQLAFTAVSVQIKALARLQRLGSSFVDSIGNEVLVTHIDSLCRKLSVPTGVTNAKELDRLLQEAHGRWMVDMKGRYYNKSIFAYESDPLASHWLSSASRHLKEGDKIKALPVQSLV